MTTGDPEVSTRIAQYEMAFRMQASVPELTDLSKEPQSRLRSLWRRREEARDFRRELSARAPIGRAGVRFIQLYHRDWDHHGNLPKGLPARCKDTDQAPPR